MSIIRRCKDIISANIALRESLHYCKDLTLMRVNNGSQQNGDTISSTSEIRINYHPDVPYDVIDKLQNYAYYNKEKGQSCLIAMHDNEAVGCVLFNHNGTGTLNYPFTYVRHFGEGHVYVHTLHVKQEYRSKGIAKRLYLESFRIFRDTYDYMDGFVDPDKYAPNEAVRKVGFFKKDRIILFKCFGMKLSLFLNSRYRETVYDMCIHTLRTVLRGVLAILIWVKQSVSTCKVRMHGPYLNVYLFNDALLDRKLSVAYICKDTMDRSIMQKLYPHGYNSVHVKTIPRKELISQCEACVGSVDMLVIDEKYSNIMNKAAYLGNITIMPKWIAQRNISFNNLDEFGKKTNSSAWNDIYESKRRNYEYIMTKNRLLVEFFVTNMYLPHVQNRYAGESEIASLKDIKNVLRRGMLLLVKNNDNYISGSVIGLKHRTVHANYVGVLNSDHALVKRDALTSLYYYYFKYAQENGIHIVDLGLSRAFLNDGVLRYKAKWRTKIEYDSKRSDVFGLRILRYSKPVIEFLLNNPFISIERGALVGNVFYDDRTVINKDDVVKRNMLLGLSEVRVIPLKTDEDKSSKNGSVLESAGSCR